MLITAAGTARPAKLLVLGTGVAGLQAIGTARKHTAGLLADVMGNTEKALALAKELGVEGPKTEEAK